MSDYDGVSNNAYHRHTDASGWFVGLVVSLALMAIGYLVFSTNNPDDPKVTEKQAACMIAHPGLECEQVTRWEPKPVLTQGD